MASPKRPQCPRCQRPLTACLCSLAQTVANRVPLLLLQHPSEAHHPKGSVDLMALSLSNIEVRVGETFAGLAAELDNSRYRDLLLYPETEQSSPAPLNDKRPPRLIALDGSWRKTYKLLQLNPCLQQLPRYRGPISKQGQYRIRKAPKAGQLSTLEACCQALGELEQAGDKYQPLLDAFVVFNQRWQGWQCRGE
ncbi:MAG: DTW domain-containing protein [Cellvibrionaceae bacterium]|nr:DTW domain-containing protein [Cellvibrionaceae bacterium]